MRRFKKTLIIVGVLLGILNFTGGAWAMNNEKYQETFPVKLGTVLKVYNKNGAIAVNSWDQDYIKVEAIKKRHWWTGFLKEPVIDVITGKEFVVRTIYSSFLCEAISVQYRITVPKGTLVQHLETSTGKIQVNETSGDLDAKTSTGGIEIHKVDGFVKAETSTGNITVDEVAKDVDAKSSTGGIQIHKVKGFVKAVTSSGKIDITEVGGLSGATNSNGKISVEIAAIRESLDIRSSNGSITVFLSPEITAELEASTSNGQITYENLPLTVNESSKTRLTGKFSGGKGRINIKTSNGSINLKKL